MLFVPFLENIGFPDSHGLFSDTMRLHWNARDMAFDTRRLQELVAQSMPDSTGVLVATMAGLSRAREILGPEVGPLEMASLMAQQQGMDMEQCLLHSMCCDRSRAAHVFEDIAIQHMRGNSCAHACDEFILVNELGLNALAVHAGTPEESHQNILDHADFYALHEAGHVAEYRLGYFLDRQRFIQIDPRIRDVSWIHSSECFADAFAVATLVARGHSPADVANIYAKHTEWPLRACQYPGLPSWPTGNTNQVHGQIIGNQTIPHSGLLCAIYATVMAASHALKTAKLGMSPSRVVEVAESSRWAGMLSADMLLAIAHGNIAQELTDNPLGQAMKKCRDDLFALHRRIAWSEPGRISSEFSTDQCPIQALLALDSYLYALVLSGFKCDFIDLKQSLFARVHSEILG